LFAIVGDFENALSVYPTDEENVADYIASYFPDDRDVFECIHQFEFENFLVKNLHYLDRLCMANSTEGRVPFLDHRVVEFAYSLPRQYKLTNLGASKKILKDTMRPYLPSYVLDRRKAGFGMPLRSLFSAPAKVWSLLDRDFFGSFDGFSVLHIERIVDHHVRGWEDNSALIYALISFQEWYKMFFDGESASLPSAQHLEAPALVN
jgi:asparagine synthase (glutamine-hydrolysing)